MCDFQFTLKSRFVFSAIFSNVVDDNVITLPHFFDTCVEVVIDFSDLRLKRFNKSIKPFLHLEKLPRQEARKKTERSIIEQGLKNLV